MQRAHAAVVIVLLIAGSSRAAMAQTGTGGSDTSKPGPLNTLANPVMAGATIALYWTEPFDDTNSPSGDGTGTGSGGPVATRQLFYRTDHALVASTDFDTATLIPIAGPILAGGVSQNLWFTPPATGVTYYFALKFNDEIVAHTSYGLSVSLAVPAPAAGQASESGGGGDDNAKCGAASTTRSAFPGLIAMLGRRVIEGYPLLVLIGALAGVGAALRRR